MRWHRANESSILSGTTKYATLADVVIAAVWRTVEPGSIPGGSTKFCKCRCRQSWVSKAQWVGTNYPSSKQVTTSTTDPYPVPGFKENTGRMVAMSGVLLLTNSTDPRFVRLCGEQSDILLNKVVSKRFKVCGSFERKSIKGRKPLMLGSYKLHFNRVRS